MRFIFPLIFIVAAVLILFTLAKPLYEEVGMLQEQSAEFDGALDRSVELQALRERLTTKYQSFTPEDLERITKLLPDSIDNVRLVLDIDDIARANQLRISNIGVGEGEEGANTGNGNQQARSAKVYQTMSLSFSTTGSYAQFRDFLADLERSLRLVTIRDLTVVSDSETGTLTYDLSLEAYWLN